MIPIRSNTTFLVLLFAFTATVTRAQHSMPVRISVFSESTSMPFSRAIATPLHPGIELGTDFRWKETNRFRLYPVVTVGYHFHKHLYQAIHISGSLGIDLKLDFGLNIKSMLGIGYMHTFTTQQEYRFSNGSYRSGPDRGNARVIPSLSLGFGYRIKPSAEISPEIFALYQTWIEFPYSPGFIPVMAHTNIHLGYKFFPFHPLH